MICKAVRQGLVLLTGLLACAPWRGTPSLLVQGTQICHYGTQPGYWIPAVNETYTWQLYDEKCQLQDLLTQRLKGAASPDPPGKRGVLFFGDSVDYRFVYYYCQELGQHPEVFGHPEVAHLHLTGICRNNTQLMLAKQHLSGASLDGPYWNSINFPPISSIDEGLQEYQDFTGDRPDVVVISSNFWDLAGWFSAANWTIAGSMMENETIPNWALAEWRQNMTEILNHVKSVAPENALLVFHTLHPPRWHHDPHYWENDRYINQHVSQLNAVGRHVAQMLHFHLLDMEVMAAQVHQNNFLVDSTHPRPWFVLQALNIILNMDLAHMRHVRALAEETSTNRFGHLGRWFGGSGGKRRSLA